MATLNDLVAKVDELQKQVEILSNRSMEGRRVLTAQGLSDIDTRLGIVQAGELRFGTRTGTFTGLRLAYPAVTVDSISTVLAGIGADVLELGIRSSDGRPIGKHLHLRGITADPSYEDGHAILYFYSSGGVDELRVRGKVGATETQATLANITP